MNSESERATMGTRAGLDACRKTTPDHCAGNGSVHCPTKRIVRVLRSQIAKTKGRSARNSGSGIGRITDRIIRTAVAAAASVPTSLTWTKAGRAHGAKDGGGGHHGATVRARVSRAAGVDRDRRHRRLPLCSTSEMARPDPGPAIAEKSAEPENASVMPSALSRPVRPIVSSSRKRGSQTWRSESAAPARSRTSKAAVSSSQRKNDRRR